MNVLDMVIRLSESQDSRMFRHGSRHGSSLVTKLTMSMFVAVWIRESGLGPPTHVRANSKPAASRAPPKALTSQARIGQVRLVTLHTRKSLTHWNPSPTGLASQTRTCLGTLNHSPENAVAVCSLEDVNSLSDS